MSKATKDKSGRHVWDGSKIIVNTSYGQLEIWKTGEIGDSSETHNAVLRTTENVSPEVLSAMALVFNLRHGDCISRYGQPTVMYNEHSSVDYTDMLGYQWLYWPSTN